MIWFSWISLHEVKDQDLVGLLQANEETTLNCNKNDNFNNSFLYENSNVGGFHFFYSPVLSCIKTSTEDELLVDPQNNNPHI